MTTVRCPKCKAHYEIPFKEYEGVRYPLLPDKESLYFLTKRCIRCNSRIESFAEDVDTVYSWLAEDEVIKEEITHHTAGLLTPIKSRRRASVFYLFSNALADRESIVNHLEKIEWEDPEIKKLLGAVVIVDWLHGNDLYPIPEVVKQQAHLYVTLPEETYGYSIGKVYPSLFAENIVASVRNKFSEVRFYSYYPTIRLPSSPLTYWLENKMCETTWNFEMYNYIMSKIESAKERSQIVIGVRTNE